MASNAGRPRLVSGPCSIDKKGWAMVKQSGAKPTARRKWTGLGATKPAEL